MRKQAAALMLSFMVLATGCGGTPGEPPAPAGAEPAPGLPAAGPGNEEATGAPVASGEREEPHPPWQPREEQPAGGSTTARPAADAPPDHVASKFIYAMLVGDTGMMRSLQAPVMVWSGTGASRFNSEDGQPRVPTILEVPELEATGTPAPGAGTANPPAGGVTYQVRFALDYGTGPEAYRGTIGLVTDPATGAWRVRQVEIHPDSGNGAG